MNPQEYAAAVRRDGAALADAAGDRLEARVPSCPEWRMSDLVWHTAQVHDFWYQVADQRLSDPREAKRAERPGDGDIVGFFRAGVERLAALIETADPAAPVWTWSPQQDIGFIQRRMAQETAVHRWDAEAAAGAAAPIEAGLAADGIDEFLTVMLPGRPEALAGDGESVHLHAIDTPGEWLVTVTGGRVEVSREHGKGDAAVRAPVSDLLLLLWRRIPPEAVDVFGDEAVLRRFVGRAQLD